MKHIATRLGAITLFAAFLAPASGLATELKSYAASTCQEAGTGESGAFNRSRYRITRVGNAGTGKLLCPVIRDGFFNVVPGRGRVQVSVNLMDNHSTSDITCTLITRSLSGASARYSTRRTQGSSVARQTLYLTADYMTSSGYALMECTLPTNSWNQYTKIYSYRVIETTPS